MVTSIRQDKQIINKGKPHAFVVEFVGPAGAGKTTIIQALNVKFPECRIGAYPPVRELSYAPFFLREIISLAPMVFSINGKGNRNLTRRELAWMAILNGWSKDIIRKAEEARPVVLLDQGPIFLIATLLKFGPHSLQGPYVTRWWEKINNIWGKMLNMAILLDAPNWILTERIRTRTKDHIVKTEPDQDVHKFLNMYREMYRDVVGKLLEKNPDMIVNHVDTSQNSVDEIVNILIKDINTIK